MVSSQRIARLFFLSLLVFFTGCPPNKKEDNKSDFIVPVEWHKIEGPSRYTWYRTRAPNGWIIYTNAGSTSPLYIPDGKALWLAYPDKED